MKEVEKKETVAYTKPVIVAQNNSTGSYAAGCPSNYGGIGNDECRRCERTR